MHFPSLKHLLKFLIFYFFFFWSFHPCGYLISVLCLMTVFIGSIMLPQHWIAQYWTTVSRGSTGSGPWEPLITTSSLPDQYRHLFCVYFCSKAPCLIPIVDSLTLNSQPTALLTHGWTKLTYLTQIFALSGTYLGPLASTSALCLGTL